MLWDWCHGLMGFHQAWSYVGIAGNEVDRRGRAAVVIMQEKRAIRMSQQLS